MKKILFLLLLTAGIMAQSRYYLQIPLMQSNGRPLNAKTVVVYPTGTTSGGTTLTYASNSPGLYYTTSPMANGTYDVYSSGYMILEKIYLNWQAQDIDNTQNAVTAASDTVQLKLMSAPNDSLGTTRYLKQLSSSNTNGGGMFVYTDSSNFVTTFGAYADIPKSLIFNSSTDGKKWVRESVYRSEVTFYDVGAIPDDSSSATATHNTTVVQELLDFAATGKVKAIIPGDVFWFNKVSGENYCLDIKPGLYLEGYGIKSGWGAGSTIGVRNGQNAIALKQHSDTGWLHSTVLKNFTINPNGAYNDTANGLYVVKMGENSEVSNIQVSDIEGYGMRFGNISAHDNVFNITLNPNANSSKNLADKERIGIWIEGGGKRSFRDISGDRMSPMIYAHGAAIFKIDGLKIEGDYSSGFTRSTVVWLDSVPVANSIAKLENFHLNLTGSIKTIVRVTGPNLFQPPVIFDMGYAFSADSLVHSEVGGQSVYNNVGRLIGLVPVVGSGGTTALNRFWDYLDFQGTGESYIRFQDSAGNYDGRIRALTDVLYVRSPGNNVVIEEDGGSDIFTFTSSGNESHVLTTFSSGVRVGTSSQIDTMKYKASGDSLQLYINGVGWKAFKLTNSAGN